MAFRLIPREEKFYTDFQALATELKRGARLLEEMLLPDRPIWDKADEIKEVEHKCDFLTHEIIQRIDRRARVGWIWRHGDAELIFDGEHDFDQPE